MTRWLYPGNAEPLKRGVHTLAFSVAAVMFGYNALAWIFRRERHLAVNAVLYGCLTEFERRQVKHHGRPTAQ